MQSQIEGNEDEGLPGSGTQGTCTGLVRCLYGLTLDGWCSPDKVRRLLKSWPTERDLNTVNVLKFQTLIGKTCLSCIVSR